jgi:hypothetical protein
MKTFRTPLEEQVGDQLAGLFEQSTSSTRTKLENFPKYVRRQHLKRLFALYELFKLILPVKGSIVECGVFEGFSLMSWAKLSAILEPENLTRRIYGFDSFAGFPASSAEDNNPIATPAAGGLRADSYDELRALIELYDQDRFLGHIPKVELVRGDISVTAPAFLESHPHLMVSMLFIDCDLYAPTKTCLQTFRSRMPKGAVIACDELDNPMWPGETTAVLDSVGIESHAWRRFEWDPYISYAVL